MNQKINLLKWLGLKYKINEENNLNENNFEKNKLLEYKEKFWKKNLINYFFIEIYKICHNWEFFSH